MTCSEHTSTWIRRSRVTLTDFRSLKSTLGLTFVTRRYNGGRIQRAWRQHVRENIDVHLLYSEYTSIIRPCTSINVTKLTRRICSPDTELAKDGSAHLGRLLFLVIEYCFGNIFDRVLEYYVLALSEDVIYFNKSFFVAVTVPVNSPFELWRQVALALSVFMLQ